jgi:hypothetical protein
LLAGARVQFRRRRQASLEPAFFDLVVLPGVVPRPAIAFVLAIFPFGLAPVPVGLISVTGTAARWSPGQSNLLSGAAPDPLSTRASNRRAGGFHLRVDAASTRGKNSL